MKCPYRTIENYYKNEDVYRTSQATLKREHLTQIVPCVKEEAHFVTNDFADCLQTECVAYQNGECTRLR